LYSDSFRTFVTLFSENSTYYFTERQSQKRKVQQIKQVQSLQDSAENTDKQETTEGQCHTRGDNQPSQETETKGIAVKNSKTEEKSGPC
jgi:hypothetical protein